VEPTPDILRRIFRAFLRYLARQCDRRNVPVECVQIKEKKVMKKLLRSGGVLCSALGLVALMASSGLADKKDAIKQANKAAEVFREIMGVPDNAVPLSVLDRAVCVAVFPDVIKGGLIVGGRKGRGVASCRLAAGGWSPPAYFDLIGGSIGLQIGAQATDLVLLFVSSDGMKSLLKSRFELGGDASVAAGPVGRAVGAGTDLRLDAQILSYSRTKGVFAGLELKGTVIKQDSDDNQAVYGDNVKPDDILKGEKDPAADVTVFPKTLAKYSKKRK
jgi:SH3 domain-containing YSC84-like protein 1